MHHPPKQNLFLLHPLSLCLFISTTILRREGMGLRLLACFGSGSSSSSRKNPSPENVTVDQELEEQRRGGAIVVELFSSQGCATSPEAELLVSRLGRGDFDDELEVPVVVLAYHVDYWDYMGWKDPYGLSQWTVRQKAYVEALRLDTMFTPQVVVQGRTHCVGTDQDAFFSLISSALRFPSPTFQATFRRPSPDSLQVSLTGALRTKVDSHGAHVMVALYENGLLTDCPKGENRGRVLSNDFVVRKLGKLCTVKDISAKKTVSGTVNFSLFEGFNSSKCGVAVFVQNSSYHTFGSQNFQLPDNI
ncbi:hypothetical protein HHK36_003799 [Tetracentron sinense]|uniref:Uncharacterized protein n=1 Tax=Tetracentron sinense TaxID=13715 RepID=A0A834ZRQ9_TETSI|nr:hypothetical protein HHK36_003799 [Tetracentron sinense]